MPNNTVSDWSVTPASNTEVGGVDLAENSMRPRDVNNAIRTVMAQIATFIGSKFSPASASSAAYLDLHEDTDNGTSRVRIIAPASLASDRTLTLLDADLTIGTAAGKNTGTSGDAVPLLNVTNTWSALQIISGTSSFFEALRVQSTNDDANGGPYMVFNRFPASGGATVAAGDDLGYFQSNGKDSGNTTTTYGEFYNQILDPTDTSEDGEWVWRVMVAGSAVDAFRASNGVQIGAPTGGYKGTGTLNAVGVYDDNTLLTCYPFDAYLDGEIDDAKWDALTPNRLSLPVYESREIEAKRDTGKVGKDGKPIFETITQMVTVEVEPPKEIERRHEDMRKFKARLGTDTDPLDLDKYIAHWKSKRHLTSLPNEEKFDPVHGLPAGAWIQRLVETVEIQAIHISQLHDRLKTLEAGATSKP